MARYGITAPKALGVSMVAIQELAREVGRDQALAEALWRTGWYEARLLAAFVAEPARVTALQMDRWTREFDNWAVCDTFCFKLFDRTLSQPVPVVTLAQGALAYLQAATLLGDDERLAGALERAENAVAACPEEVRRDLLPLLDQLKAAPPTPA